MKVITPPYAPFNKPNKKVNFMKMMIEESEEKQTTRPCTNSTTQLRAGVHWGRKYYIIPSIYKNKQTGGYFSIYGDGKWTLKDGEKFLCRRRKKKLFMTLICKKAKKRFIVRRRPRKIITVAEKRGIHISTLLSMFDSTRKAGDGSDEKGQKSDKLFC